MGQFIKFTLASCLGVFIAMCLVFFLVIMIALGAAEAGKSVEIKDPGVLKIDLDYQAPEHTDNVRSTSFSLREENVVGIQDILNMIEAAKEDPKIQGIYLYPTKMYLGTTQTGRLCDAIRDFRAAGKWVVSYAEYYPQGSYAVAAQADTVILNPIGSVEFRGYASFVPFFKDLLDKTGVKVQVYYAGKFKGATEPFRRSDMSPENKEQTREYLDDAYDFYLRNVSEGRHIEKSRLWDIANGIKSQNAEDALALGLIDKIGYEDEAFSWMRRHLGLDSDEDIPFVTINDYYLGRTKPLSTAHDRIAVVYAEGDIVPGETDYGVIGDERYVKVLTDLRKDDRIKALVLRVNSPGGNILAAENILRELLLFKEAGKPVVVSMGDYAASGGYYISAMADSIFAEQTTLTGSIGVFSLIPNVSELFNDKLGIHFDTVRTGDFSAAFSPFFEWSDAEGVAMQSRIDTYYDLFLTHVSEYRHMTKDEVNDIAQGHIWSGERALKNGLIDRIGTIDDAIHAAAHLAGITEYRTSEYPRVPNQLNKIIMELTGDETSVAERIVDKKLAREAPQLMELKQILSYTEPAARLPLLLDF